MRCRTGDLRLVLYYYQKLFTNMVAELLIMTQRRLVDANLQWLLMSGTSPFICKPCICSEGKRVVLGLPVFTACLSKWACGGLEGHSRSNHTQREESRNPGGPLKVMRFYNYCFIYDYCSCRRCCARTHTHVCSNRLTYTYP